MGCGPDLFRLFDLADDLVRENRSRRSAVAGRPATATPAGPSLREELYEMFGRGEIDERTFRQLKELADRGELRPVDLAVLRFERQRRTAPLRTEEGEEAAALRQLRARIAQLEGAREASLRTLEELRAQIADVQARADRREEAARLAVAADEALARRYLQERQVLLETQERLEAQARALEEDLEKLEALKAQLEARVAELEALQARQALSSLRAELAGGEAG